MSTSSFVAAVVLTSPYLVENHPIKNKFLVLNFHRTITMSYLNIPRYYYHLYYIKGTSSRFKVFSLGRGNTQNLKP